MNVPSIQRRTDKKLPRYRDGLEEDVFLFAGAEDLVPYLEPIDQTNTFQNKEHLTLDGYKVKRYRPRIEGGFARIEKITSPEAVVYWKVTTGENIVTIFGRRAASRIADPEDPKKIFQWMADFSFDDKGNWIQYHYKKDSNLHADGSLNSDESIPNEIFEKNRKSGLAAFTNTYLKRVSYGNRNAYFLDPTKAYDPLIPENEPFFFELLFDFGEHDALNPTPEEIKPWDYRKDAFSSFRAGFEIRTQRLCKRILMFHHFENEKQFVGTPEEQDFGKDYLVHSVNLSFQSSNVNSSTQSEVVYLKSITEYGYIRNSLNAIESYTKKSLPPMEFAYQALNWSTTIKTVEKESMVNAPVGLGQNYQWVDLYSEGISGILTEQGGAWFYKNNLGLVDQKLQFTEAKEVIPKPAYLGLFNGALSIRDLASNGKKQLLVHAEHTKGYFELDQQDNWQNFKAFQQTANIDWQDPNTRLIDLNGDGQTELVVTEDNVFVWYPSKGKEGYATAEFAKKHFDEEQGPAIVFADQELKIFLADMTGDGLTDIVRIRNGEICYWANKGYGKFSAKINMKNAPLLDHPDAYHPRYLHLADISGTGTTDLIYLGKNKFRAFLNLSGNAWSTVHEIDPFFQIDRNSQFSVVDLLGKATPCLVWSSNLPAHKNAPLKYIDLMSGKKPHLLIHYKNNFGKETSIEYKSSIDYYLADKLAGKPWLTKLPFPVQVVSKRIIEETITDVRFTTTYQYHHGYYDHTEKEFRGFGMVEQIDSENYSEWKLNNSNNQLEKSEALYQAPVLIKTWFHTGAFLDRKKILNQFKEDYWYKELQRQFPELQLNLKELELPDAQMDAAIGQLSGEEYREALRACKGMVLRQETFALDAPENPSNADLQQQLKPYAVETHNCYIRLQQPRDKNPYAVFLVGESEAISIQYERKETDYRLKHKLNTKIDDLGNVLESAEVVYGRKMANANAAFQELRDQLSDFTEEVLLNNANQKLQLKAAFDQNIQSAIQAQRTTKIIYTQSSYAKYDDGINQFDDIDLPEAYRLRLPFERKQFEITGKNPQTEFFQLAELEKIQFEDFCL